MVEWAGVRGLPRAVVRDWTGVAVTIPLVVEGVSKATLVSKATNSMIHPKRHLRMQTRDKAMCEFIGVRGKHVMGGGSSPWLVVSPCRSRTPCETPTPLPW